MTEVGQTTRRAAGPGDDPLRSLFTSHDAPMVRVATALLGDAAAADPRRDVTKTCDWDGQRFQLGETSDVVDIPPVYPNGVPPWIAHPGEHPAETTLVP